MARALGIDAGGTSTKAVLLDEGQVVWEAQGAAANLATGDIDSLRELLQGCPKPDAVCGAFAGLVSKSRQQSAMDYLQVEFPGAEVRVVADFEAALEACRPRANVCVIAGTGSIVCSKAGAEVKRTGGRGYVLGDEGSGFQFGRDAFLHFLDGPSPEVSAELSRAVEATFGTLDKGEAVASLYGKPGLAGRLAGLAPALAKDAERGERYALDSLNRNMAMLAGVCLRHVRTYGPAEPVFGCQGGLWKSAVYRGAFAQAAERLLEISQDSIVFDLPDPAFGAACLATELL